MHTQHNRTVEITAPAILSADDLTRVKSLVNQLEQAILYADDLGTESIIHLDSWARKYLIDEIFTNFDSDLASSFFYYQNGTFYSGPVRDYDMTFGSMPPTQNPCAFYARLYHKYFHSTSAYYSALYKNKHFYNLVTEIYQTEYLSLLEHMLDVGIQQTAREIAAAAECNRLRWSISNPVANSIDALSHFLSERIAFLSSVWIDGEPYCSVQLQHTPGGFFQNLSIQAGEIYGGEM